MEIAAVAFAIIEEDFLDCTDKVVQLMSTVRKRNVEYCLQLRESHTRLNVPQNHWIDTYHENVFFQLFRMTKYTFRRLLAIVLEADKYRIINKKYRGGHIPIPPDKGLLAFLWYLGHQDTLHSIADRFNIVPSTLMHIVNSFLYVINGLKRKFIFWPKTNEEIRHVVDGFKNYPGVLGAVDGSHINLKVPNAQHDSYTDRYMAHSINLMAICTSQKVLTYIFVGYPGSAHDSRVFANSVFVQNIDSQGAAIYFPSENYHILGDGAFPIRPWLMTPYRQTANMTRRQRIHNFKLSSDRVAIENCFGIIKGRFRRLQFINTYSVSKAIEITTACCIIHNFCYLNNDQWEGELFNNNQEQDVVMNDIHMDLVARQKRDRIALQLE